MPKKPRYQLTKVNLPDSGEVRIYFSPKVSNALLEVTEDMTVYKGVRLGTLLEAAYSQGRKDGARQVFEEAEKSQQALRKLIPHQNPGRPKKKK